MRIFLILLLFTLLSVQSPAAATVACCGNTQAVERLHNKLHQSAHGLAMAVWNEDGAVSGSSFDLDCGTCHTNCVAAVSTIAATFADPAGIERVEHFEETRMPPWHARPYRPQWLTRIRSALSTAA